MNKAQETLRKIAEALNIASEPTPVVAEPVAEVTPVAEPAPAEAVPVVAAEPAPAVVEPAPVEPTEPAPVEPAPVADTRVADLEAQLADMKKILADAMREPEPVAAPAPVAGLTHSPEAVVATKANGIGKKGASIQDRVHAYINGTK